MTIYADMTASSNITKRHFLNSRIAVFILYIISNTLNTKKLPEQS